MEKIAIKKEKMHNSSLAQKLLHPLAELGETFHSSPQFQFPMRLIERWMIV
jgi:hypothetical protein